MVACNCMQLCVSLKTRRLSTRKEGDVVKYTYVDWAQTVASKCRIGASAIYDLDMLNRIYD